MQSLRWMAVAIGLSVLLAGASCQAAAGGIPFTVAEVTSTDGTVFNVTWQGEGVRSVRVFAGPAPDRIDRSREVAHGGARDAAKIGPLPAAPRWYFELSPDRGDALVIAERSLRLASAPNFRDIGGYRTGDGKWVRMGLMYRSDGLESLSDADLATVAALHLHLVCDLRTDKERTKGRDRLPADVEAAVFDVAGAENEEGRRLTAAMANREDEQRLLGNGGADGLMQALYRDFAVDATAQDAYHRLFARLSQSDTLPSTFHCSAGKDRSGWAAAVLLTLLGVPDQTVMADYLASNDYLRASHEKMVQRLAAKLDPAPLEPIFTVRAAYLATALRAMGDQYGSFDNYLARGLKLDASTQQSLRRIMLIE